MVCRVVAAGALFFLTVWAGAIAVLWAGEPYLVFNTAMSRSDTALPDPKLFESRVIPDGNQRSLNALVLEHTDEEDRHWILFCLPAGASTKVRDIQHQLERLWNLGYNVFAFDYRGFGATSGTPTEQGLYEDATAAYRYLMRSERVPSSRIILAGRSLGSAVAVDLATKVPAAGLILFAPIDSVPAVAARLYPWAPVRLLGSYEFDSFAKATTIDLPVVLFHGWPDSYMRPSDARVLFEQFRGQKLMVKTGGGHHHAGFDDAAALYLALKKFWPPKAVAAAAQAEQSSGREAACRKASVSGEATYTIRGTLFLADGGGSGYRIGVNGTKRLLWVTNRVEPPVPPEVGDKLKSFDEAVAGSWTLVPIRNDRPGVMREVCVVSVDNVEVQAKKNARP